MARDEHAVLGRDQVRLDVVGAELDAERVVLERVVGEVAGRAAAVRRSISIVCTKLPAVPAGSNPSRLNCAPTYSAAICSSRVPLPRPLSASLARNSRCARTEASLTGAAAAGAGDCDGTIAGAAWRAQPGTSRMEMMGKRRPRGLRIRRSIQ